MTKWILGPVAATLVVSTAFASSSSSASGSSLGVGDLPDWLNVLLTGCLLMLAWSQLSQVIAQQKQEIEQRSMWASLQTADRYDSDEVIVAARDLVLLTIEKPESATDDFQLKRAFVTLFNFFDSIAIGLACGMYHKGIMKQHAAGIIVDWIEDISSATHPVLASQWDEMEDRYTALMSLYREWKGLSPAGK